MMSWSIRTGLVLVIFLVSNSKASRPVKHADHQQLLQSLNSWNGYHEPDAPFSHQNTKYNPLKSTRDAARLWSPIYPNQVLLSNVTVDLQPVCKWPRVYDVSMKYVGHNRTKECPLENQTDVLVSIVMNYAVYGGRLDKGSKSIADSLTAESPVPWIMSVVDGEDADLSYNIYRDPSSKRWWIDYQFVKPADRQYVVKLKYQIRNVLFGEKQGENRFSAAWLQEWDAPVQSMDIVWAFPPNFHPSKFSVDPGNNSPNLGPSQMTAICCDGEGGKESAKEPSKCTFDKETGARWMSSDSSSDNCKGSSVKLTTSLRLASGIFGDTSAGVNLDNLYSVSFSPGLVTQANKNTPESRSYLWIVPLCLILLFPLLGAIFWTMSSSPAPSKSSKEFRDA